jgi:hypothetical protein
MQEAKAMNGKALTVYLALGVKATGWVLALVVGFAALNKIGYLYAKERLSSK